MTFRCCGRIGMVHHPSMPPCQPPFVPPLSNISTEIHLICFPSFATTSFGLPLIAFPHVQSFVIQHSFLFSSKRIQPMNIHCLALMISAILLISTSLQSDSFYDSTLAVNRHMAWHERIQYNLTIQVTLWIGPN